MEKISEFQVREMRRTYCPVSLSNGSLSVKRLEDQDEGGGAGGREWVGENREDMGNVDYYLSDGFPKDILSARIKNLEDPDCHSFVCKRKPREGEEGLDEEEVVGFVEFGPRRFYEDLDRPLSNFSFQSLPPSKVERFLPCDLQNQGLVVWERGIKERIDPESRWEIYCLYVSKDFKGLGLGKELVRRALRTSFQGSTTSDGVMGKVWDKGKDRLIVVTLKSNSPAIAFYSRLGAQLRYYLPNYDAGGKKVQVVGLEWDPEGIQRLVSLK
ncbi:hypothetical protein IE53DRAFT_369619 [Violaceomyces palustris]|uniref:Uncharacterized protein n=1 Tax=Violaceomyces palustris TaxID=1673888 RepID=A0ACD0NV09_9BASI|nr:hypothetical protein IE53DRAFT_369619 [Violaceomyces palustris]